MKQYQNNIVYVGQTSLGLEKLEKNHRQAREKNYTMTKFRTALEDESNGKYRWEWLVCPGPRTELEVTQLEDELIRKHLPRLNEKYDNCNKQKFDTEVKFRGVYGVTYEEF